jgi:hypothetical protein
MAVAARVFGRVTSGADDHFVSTRRQPFPEVSMPHRQQNENEVPRRDQFETLRNHYLKMTQDWSRKRLQDMEYASSSTTTGQDQALH